MIAVLTNVTPNYDVQVREVQLRGIKGSVAWQHASSFEPGHGFVTGATLPADTPVDAHLIVVLERPSLPPGPHRARMVIKDNLGQQHKAPKMTFRDSREFVTPP